MEPLSAISLKDISLRGPPPFPYVSIVRLAGMYSRYYHRVTRVIIGHLCAALLFSCRNLFEEWNIHNIRLHFMECILTVELLRKKATMIAKVIKLIKCSFVALFSFKFFSSYLHIGHWIRMDKHWKLHYINRLISIL